MRSCDAEFHDWREWRRLRALELARSGWTRPAIAVALDVSDSSVDHWLATARVGGAQSLCSHPRPGRAPGLSPEQLRRLPDFLWHGAEAYGFRGDVWTCGRVAGVLEEEFGVSYSKSQVSRLLKRLGWTPQVPITRAIQRNEEEINRWRVESWTTLKKMARRQRLTLVFVDESGFYLMPSVVRTYATRGHRPVLNKCQTRDHLSVMGAITPGGEVYSLVRTESLNGLHTVEFLVHLVRMLGERLLVIWDGSPIHRRAEVRAFLSELPRGRIHVEALPSYAPDLNPVEWLWQQVKDKEMSNLSCLDLEQLHMEFHVALGRVRQRQALIQSFFGAAGLGL